MLITSTVFSSIHALVSIEPAKTFLKAIAGDKVNIEVMVQAGSSPHNYEPKPSQMLFVAKAKLYFAIGVEFEKVWLHKFTNLNPNIKVIDLSQNIEKHAMHAHHEGHEEKAQDPHIWTAPHNVAIIAQTIYQSLLVIDPNNQAYYQKNLTAFLEKIKQTDSKIKALLSTLKAPRSFMVFHPSWGYFAKAYNLQQIAVEVEGKSPKPKALISLIKKARAQKVHAILTQPEFSDKSAKIIAHELAIPVRKISPLASDWSKNLENIAHIIAQTKQEN